MFSLFFINKPMLPNLTLSLYESRLTQGHDFYINLSMIGQSFCCHIPSFVEIGPLVPEKKVLTLDLQKQLIKWGHLLAYTCSVISWKTCSSGASYKARHIKGLQILDLAYKAKPSHRYV